MHWNSGFIHSLPRGAVCVNTNVCIISPCQLPFPQSWWARCVTEHTTVRSEFTASGWASRKCMSFSVSAGLISCNAYSTKHQEIRKGHQSSAKHLPRICLHVSLTRKCGLDMLLLDTDLKCCSFLSMMGFSCMEYNCFILLSACLYITLHSPYLILQLQIHPNACSDISTKHSSLWSSL